MLSSLYDKVSSTIDAQSVARNMFQSNALTLKELQTIQSKHNQPVKAAEQLLNIVINASGNVYSCFLDALKETSRDIFKVVVSGRCKGRYNVIRVTCCIFVLAYILRLFTTKVDIHKSRNTQKTYNETQKYTMNIQAKIQKIKTPTYHIKQWTQSNQ